MTRLNESCSRWLAQRAKIVDMVADNGGSFEDAVHAAFLVAPGPFSQVMAIAEDRWPRSPALVGAIRPQSLRVEPLSAA